MKVDIVTSFNQPYYDKIGKASVESWLKFWPSSLELTCYVENMALPKTLRIRQIDFDQLGNEYKTFQASDEKDRVKTFAKKAYCVMHACNNTDADRVIWLDADVITNAEVPLEFVKDLCPKDSLATFMGVEHDGWFSAETGIFVLNRQHTHFKSFVDRYQQRYNTHDKTDMRRFYDGEVFGAVVSEFIKQGVKFTNLCEEFNNGYKTPIKHTILGPYFAHHKSKSSKAGFVQDQ